MSDKVQITIDPDNYPSHYPVPDPEWYGDFCAVFGRPPTDEECWMAVHLDEAIDHLTALVENSEGLAKMCENGSPFEVSRTVAAAFVNRLSESWS